MTRQHTVLVLILMLAFIAACSGNTPPTDPPLGDSTIPAMCGETPQHNGQRVLWGSWQVIVDRSTLEPSIIPVRSGSLHINALIFLEPPSGSTLGLSNLTIDGTTLECDVTLTHPFPGLDRYAGFDVRGILVSSGTITGFADSDITIAGPGETRILNADGQTRWWNTVEFPDNGTMFSYRDGKLGNPDSVVGYTSTLNTYKAFADCLDADDPITMLVDPGLSSTEKRAIFSPGQVNTRHYVIDFADDGTGGPDIVFNYAVDASWEPVDPPPVILPDDFPLNANSLEPFIVEIIETSNTLYCTEDEGSGGSLGLDIHVYDWQGALGDTGNVGDQVVDVTLESLTCFTGQQHALLVAGSGAGETYSTWHIEVAGEPDSIEDQMLLVTVVSSEGDWQPDFTGFTGSAPLASYMIAWASVSSIPPMNATLTLITPNGGETWQQDCPYDIEWESDGDPIDDVKLEYSTDGFTTDINVIVESTPNDGEYEWEPSGFASDTARVRVAAVGEPGIYDISDGDFSVNAPGPAIWPTAKYNYQHRGVSPNNGPATNNLKWSINIGVAMTPGPTIGDDGTIYVGTNDGRFFAVDSDGEILWELSLGSFVLGSASITDEGRIYVGSWGSPTGYLYAIECEGDIVWQFDCEGNINKATPAIADDGTVYIGNNNGKLWAINPDGTEKWSFILGGGYTPSPAIGSDGSVYVTGTGQHAYGITDNGQDDYTVFWDHHFVGEHIGCPPSVDVDNPLVDNDVVYISGLYLDSVWACDPFTDTVLWTGSTGSGFGETCATIGPDHTVYTGCNDGQVYAFEQGGNLLWTYPTGDQVAAGPILDPEGRLYFPSRDGNIYCVDSSDGSLIWSYSTGGGMIRSEVAIAPDGTLYVSGHSGILRAFQDE